ncbi:MAG: hypothetical protein WD077_13580 [Bacteroidia bacterium]
MKKLLLLLFFILLMSNGQSLANVEGAEITYSKLGGEKYLLTLRVYLSCPQGQDSYLNLKAKTSCDTAIFSLPLVSSSVISPVCKSACVCGSACYIGTIERVYQDTVDLSAFGCCDVIFSYYKVGGRNLNFNNKPFYIDAFLDKCALGGNNSVQFSFIHPSLLYLNEQARINLGGYDVDGDTVIYKLAPYLEDENTAHTSGRPYNDPVQTSLAGFDLDSITGSMIYRPIGGVKHIIKLEATEIRNDTVIGRISREFTIWTDNFGANSIPTLSGINNTQDYKIEVCLGDSIDFSIYSSDGNTFSDTTFIEWNEYIPGANYTINPGRRQSASFKWIPDSSDVRATPYIVVARVKDNHCDVLGIRDYAYNIVIHNDPPANASITAYNDCGIMKFSANTDTARSELSFEWYGEAGFADSTRTPEFIYPGVGNYKAYLKIHSGNGCLLFFDSTTINYNTTQLEIQVSSDTMVCPGNSVGISALASGGKAPYSYLWSTADTLSFVNLQAINDDTISVLITDDSNCQITDSVIVGVFSLNPVYAGKDFEACLNESSVTLVGLPTGGSWNGTGVHSGNKFSPGVADTGFHELIYEFPDGNGCEGSDTVVVKVKPLPEVVAEANFNICEDAPIHILSATPTGGTWAGPGVSGNRFFPANAGTGTHYLTYSYLGQCLNTDRVIVNVWPSPSVFAGNDTAICLYPELLVLEGTPAGGIWSGPAVSANKFDPVVAGEGIYDLRYEFTDTLGCFVSDSISVEVNPIPSFNFTFDVIPHMKKLH